MSQLITDSKVQKNSSQHQHNEAHYGSNSNILITLKNLKNERAKHHQEIAVTKNAQSNDYEGNINSYLTKRRHSRGDVHEDHSAKKLQEIENQLRSCKNQRKEVMVVTKDICNAILKNKGNNERMQNNDKLRNGSKQREQQKQQIAFIQSGMENKENISRIECNDNKNSINIKQGIQVDKQSGLDKPSRSPIITKEYEQDGQQQNNIKQQLQRIPPKQSQKQPGSNVLNSLSIQQKNNIISQYQTKESNNNDSKPFYLGQQPKELISKSRSKSYSLFFHSQKQLEEQQQPQQQHKEHLEQDIQLNKQGSYQVQHNSQERQKSKQFQQIYHSLQQQERVPPKSAIPLRKSSQKTTISQQIIPKYFSEVQSKHVNHNSIETPDKYSSKQKANGSSSISSCCIPILDQRRQSQNSMHNQSNLNTSQFSNEKQKRVFSAQGITRGSQQLQQQQQQSSVLINKGYYNNLKDNNLSAKKKNYQSISAMENHKSSIEQKQSTTIETKRYDDCGVESTSKQRIPSNSVSELRLKRIKEQNASKSRILLGLSSNENAQNKLELVESKQQQSSYLGSLIEDKSGALKEGAKKRIKDLIELQNKKKQNKDGHIQEEKLTKEQLNVEPDEIKGYIKGLMQVLNSINSSSKQIIKKEEEEEPQIQLKNSITTTSISKSQRSSSTSSQINNASNCKKQYNAMDYGYSQGMSSEILHSVIIKKKELSADYKDNRSHRSLSPNANNNSSLNQQQALSQSKDKNHDKQLKSSRVFEGVTSIRDQNCINDNNSKQLCDNDITSQKYYLKQCGNSVNEPTGRRLSITDLKTDKIDSYNDNKIEQQKEQRFVQGIENNNQCSWFRSSEPKGNKSSQDQEDFVNSKNSRKEGLIKVHRGRNIIKAINPYRSAGSLEQLKKSSNSKGSIDVNIQEKCNDQIDGSKKQDIIKNKQRSFTQYSQTKLSNNETDCVKVVDQATRKKLSLVIEDGCSVLQKCSFIDDAETVKTEQDCVGRQNDNVVVQNGNYLSAKEEKEEGQENKKNLVLFEDENHNEVSVISVVAHQLANSKIRNSFINSDLMCDLNLKRDSNINMICQQQQQQEIIKSRDNQNHINKSNQMKNHYKYPQNEDYNSQIQNLESEKKISKKPPTHKQMPKRHTFNIQNDAQIEQQQQQQQQKLSSKYGQLPLNQNNNQMNILNRQSSRARLMSAQRVPTKYEILGSYQQQQQLDNNQEDFSNHKNTSNNNNNNNSNSNGERILDLLLLNTNELKYQFQEQKQQQQQPQQQQQSIKKVRSYSSVISSLPVPPQIPHNMNIFSEFAQQFFPPDSQLI